MSHLVVTFLFLVKRFRVKEQMKNSRDMLRDFVPKTMESNAAMEKHHGIETRYKMLISTQN